MRSIRILIAFALIAVALGSGIPMPDANAATTPSAACITFPETGKTVCDRFLDYWQQNGGLAQQGFPLTDTFTEINPTDGKPYLTQYFERARFEYHPENQPPYDVLLGLLGREQLQSKYPGGTPAGITGNPLGANCATFPATSKQVCGAFLDYWTANGGLAQQGLPLTDLFLETNPTDGKQYPTQYFERARFEYHVENVGTPYVVLLGLLGREQLLAKYPNGVPGPGASPSPAPSREQATVTEVVDGDTIRVRLASGQVETVRYIGVDTPETVQPNTPVQCFGPEATARNRQLVEGKTVELEKDVTERDRFGRLLRYVFVGGAHIGEVLVREGYARSVAYPPDTKYQTALDAAQREAQQAGRGLWSACQASPSPSVMPSPSPSTAPSPQPSPSPPAANCDPSYPTVCIPPPPPDLDCGQIPHRNFKVLPPDPHRFDGDRDGVGCET
jgi:micrococcal nuclease